MMDALEIVNSPQDFESADAAHRPDLLEFAAAAREVAQELERLRELKASVHDYYAAMVEDFDGDPESEHAYLTRMFDLAGI